MFKDVSLDFVMSLKTVNRFVLLFFLVEPVSKSPVCLEPSANKTEFLSEAKCISVHGRSGHKETKFSSPESTSLFPSLAQFNPVTATSRQTSTSEHTSD